MQCRITTEQFKDKIDRLVMHGRRTVASVAQHDSSEDESLKRDKKNWRSASIRNAMLLRELSIASQEDSVGISSNYQ
jgi:hypothetical protein